jgi:hypothetical protein
MIDTAWMAGAAAFDLATTRYALSHCPRCREGNPFMQSTAGATALKVGAVAVSGWGCYELRKHGHTTAAKWVRWTIVAIWSGAAINNLMKTGDRK